MLVFLLDILEELDLLVEFISHGLIDDIDEPGSDLHVMLLVEVDGIELILHLVYQDIGGLDVEVEEFVELVEDLVVLVGEFEYCL